MRTLILALVLALSFGVDVKASSQPDGRFLYVAVPGIRNYLEFGGHGVLVYDIDRGHKLVRRIPAAGVDDNGKPVNVKGICASAATGRLYVSTIKTLTCFDLHTDKILWEKAYEGGCDRMSMTPDGKTIYLPSFEKAHWHVVDALAGNVVTTITPNSNAHNTVVGLDGTKAYLAGLKSPLLEVVDTKTNQTIRQVGPFTKPIRPFTVNGRQTLVFVNVNDLLGFEVGDIVTGKKLHRVVVDGYKIGPVKRHGCPSHGIGLTPDETQAWVCDAYNQRLHVFDLSGMNESVAPRQIASIPVREQPGWITFSLDGKYAYPSTGEVIDVATREVVATLSDEKGGEVHSEKVVEVHFAGGKVVRTGDQFGLGRVTAAKR